MTNTLVVCLFASLFCLISARQIPPECAKGPSFWCANLRQAADCGAVGHCIATIWEPNVEKVNNNDVTDKIIRLFQELKDVKDLINEDYLAARVNTGCRELTNNLAIKTCKLNTAGLEQYLSHVLTSSTTPETMCKVIGICNNMKIENALALEKNMPPPYNKEKLLGSERCTWGPSYWCSNFSTCRECSATHHCVQRVWSKMAFPVDNDGICKICTDMVTQARDQLQSNETQEELKEVFEGSCKLIPIKVISSECIKMADEFVPELVETLASQMNPQAVCSVAGLCNNARIDALLEEYEKQKEMRVGCTNCQKTVTVLRKRFDTASVDDFLFGMLQMCRGMDSLSDSCSMLVFKYYENIVEALKKDLNPDSICHLSSQCVHRYHTHDEFVFPEESRETIQATEDVPCEFCEQLVVHLRDILTANTTEDEFYRVLKGLCKQTGNFKSECLHLAEEYYPTIYKYLVNDLKGNQICTMIGVCKDKIEGVPIAPLLPTELTIKVITPASKLIGTDEANSYKYEKEGHIPIGGKQTNVKIIGEATEAPLQPLPIERMFISMPPKQNKAACSFCQYFLHYLQVELSDSKNEDKIKDAVEMACEKLPQSVNSECKQFVTEYGPAVIALLVQEIDPASVCPAIGLCPQTQEVRRVDINSEKSNCPLCLFAVEQLETMLKNNRSEDNIRQALDKLCNHLSTKLRTECIDFVDTYSKQLVEMLVANMDAQEICVYLKLCTNNAPNPLKLSAIDKYHEKPYLRGDRNNKRRPMLPEHMLSGSDIETNEIPDNTVNGRPVKTKNVKTICVICEFVLKEIDDQIRDKHNDDEIKKVVHGVCKHMPKSVKSDCDQFVEKYADLVISMLAQELDPSEVCQELKLCPPAVNSLDAVKEEILDCAVCQTVVMAVKKVLNNDKVDRNVVHIVEKACAMLPAKYSARCQTMMEIYGDSVIHLIEDYGTKQICGKIGLCNAQAATYVEVYNDTKH